MFAPSLVSWPMYAVDDTAVRALWIALRAAMRDAGLTDVPDELTDPADLMAHWSDPALLLSQTCGFPFATRLRGTVRYVCTPRFRVPGCEGASYRSAIVVRDDEPAQHLGQLRGRRAAYNSRDSHSGYNAFRLAVAPYAQAGRFFSAVIETGSHRASLNAVRERLADVAAIDAVTLALVAAERSSELKGLRTLGFTEAAAGLPLVTGRRTDDDRLDRLRRACAAACDPTRTAAGPMLLDGVAVLDDSAYDALKSMQSQAEALGYPELA
jgi:ABC-type phosphate/phosphonate transport system substrate-binding protein